MGRDTMRGHDGYCVCVCVCVSVSALKRRGDGIDLIWWWWGEDELCCCSNGAPNIWQTHITFSRLLCQLHCDLRASLSQRHKKRLRWRLQALLRQYRDNYVADCCLCGVHYGSKYFWSKWLCAREQTHSTFIYSNNLNQPKSCTGRYAKNTN